MQARTLVRSLIFFAGAVLLAALLCVASLWLHFHNAPDFDAYVRSRPVSAGLIAARWPQAEVLAKGRDWRIGEVDPFALAAEDPLWTVHSLRFSAAISHGDETLATLTGQVAVAAERTSGDRAGLAIRLQVTQIDPRMRVVARAWVDDDGAIGPESTGLGRVVFDVMAAAGPGENELSVARLPSTELVDLEELGVSDPSTFLFGAMFEPSGSVLEEGLLYHVRQPVYLSWRNRPDGSSSAGYGRVETWRSTSEYSYSIQCKFEDAGFSSSSQESALLSWNSHVW